MLDEDFVQHLQSVLTEQRNKSLTIQNQAPAGGGCINASYQLETSDNIHAFVKVNQARLLDMFEAESEGLNVLRSANCFVIPKPLGTGVWHGKSYLLMDFIELGGSCTEQDFAARLAQLHQHTDPAFGFHRDNYIGASPQSNSQHDNWFEFFMHRRLEKQLQLLVDQGRGQRLQSQWPELIKACEQLFSNHKPKASLLHGDLWQGNVSLSKQGCSIYDPAVYYGDHETDLAMLTLFGHLTKSFYQSYQKVFPIQSGYELRIVWYNLYHILNHANLFGDSYINQAEAMINKLILALNE